MRLLTLLFVITTFFPILAFMSMMQFLEIIRGYHQVSVSVIFGNYRSLYIYNVVPHPILTLSLCFLLFQLGPPQLTVALKLLLQFHRCPLPSSHSPVVIRKCKNKMNHHQFATVPPNRRNSRSGFNILLVFMSW